MRKTIYKIMMAVFFLSLMAADSPSLLPIASLVISGTWLTVAAWRNGWLYKEGDSDV